MDDLKWIEDIVPVKPKTIDTLEVGDVVYYNGIYDWCHHTPYIITKTYSNYIGIKNMWFDLSMEDPDPFVDAYEVLWSVPWNQIVIQK